MYIIKWEPQKLISIHAINLILKHLVFRTRLKAIAPNRYTLYVSSNVLVARRASKKIGLFLLQLCIAVSVTSIFYTYGKNISNTFDKSLALKSCISKPNTSLPYYFQVIEIMSRSIHLGAHESLIISTIFCQ